MSKEVEAEHIAVIDRSLNKLESGELLTRFEETEVMTALKSLINTKGMKTGDKDLLTMAISDIFLRYFYPNQTDAYTQRLTLLCAKNTSERVNSLRQSIQQKKEELRIEGQRATPQGQTFRSVKQQIRKLSQGSTGLFEIRQIRAKTDFICNRTLVVDVHQTLGVDWSAYELLDLVPLAGWLRFNAKPSDKELGDFIGNLLEDITYESNIARNRSKPHYVKLQTLVKLVTGLIIQYQELGLEILTLSDLSSAGLVVPDEHSPEHRVIGQEKRRAMFESIKTGQKSVIEKLAKLEEGGATDVERRIIWMIVIHYTAAVLKNPNYKLSITQLLPRLLEEHQVSPDPEQFKNLKNKAEYVIKVFKKDLSILWETAKRQDYQLNKLRN